MAQIRLTLMGQNFVMEKYMFKKMSKREFIAASAALTGSLLISKTAMGSTKYEILMPVSYTHLTLPTSDLV